LYCSKYYLPDRVPVGYQIAGETVVSSTELLRRVVGAVSSTARDIARLALAVDGIRPKTFESRVDYLHTLSLAYTLKPPKKLYAFQKTLLDLNFFKTPEPSLLVGYL